MVKSGKMVKSLEVFSKLQVLYKGNVSSFWTNLI